MKKIFILTGLLILFYSCNLNTMETTSSEQQELGEFKTVTIGDQIWMAENLNVSHFRNGDEIPEFQSEEKWKLAGEVGTSAWCYMDGDSNNEKKTGKLYNWHAVNDPRGLAPDGWRVATVEDWEKLIKHLGGKENAGKALKSDYAWNDRNGNNESGFTAIPSGARRMGFGGVGMNGNYWTSSEFDEYFSYFYILSQYNYEVMKEETGRVNGFSVRCVKE